ncbi:ISLre2 family transposase [Bacteroides heparinolyticus]|uniref:ISLre2 family transposase n=1 Tax=Prevotella heparinolytica TaxID=28113 RepID=UPI0035A172BE
MDNIILQKLIEWANEIEKLTESEEIIDIDALGTKIFDCSKTISLDIMAAVISKINRRIRNDKIGRKDSGVVIKEKSIPRTVMLMVGPLTYERDYCYDKNTQRYFYPVDEILSVEKRERIGKSVRAELVNKATEYSYAKSANIVTDGKVSRQSVRNSILKIKIPEKKAKETGKEVRELHIFADEDHAHMQKPGKAKGKKNQIVPMVTVTEGIVPISKNRNATVNAMYFVDEAFDAKRLWESVDGYISVAYSNETLHKVYLHGDGGNWIKNGLSERSDVVRVMDGYHFEKRTREIAKIYPTARVRSRVSSAIINGDKYQLETIIKSLLCNAPDMKAYRRTKEYGKYLFSYYEEIRNRLVLNIPGSCTEGLVSHVLSSRFSRNPMGWSAKGLGTLSKAKVYVLNGGILSAKDYRTGKVTRYSEYSKQTLKSICEKKYDWSIFENERPIMNGTTGTQNAIKQIGRLGAVI